MFSFFFAYSQPDCQTVRTREPQLRLSVAASRVSFETFVRLVALLGGPRLPAAGVPPGAADRSGAACRLPEGALAAFDAFFAHETGVVTGLGRRAEVHLSADRAWGHGIDRTLDLVLNDGARHGDGLFAVVIERARRAESNHVTDLSFNSRASVLGDHALLFKDLANCHLAEVATRLPRAGCRGKNGCPTAAVLLGVSAEVALAILDTLVAGASHRPDERHFLCHDGHNRKREVQHS